MIINTQVRGVDFKVIVTTEGKFTTAYDGETFEEATLDGLRSRLGRTIFASKEKVEFVTDDGDWGFTRGFHQAERKILVTIDGEKKKVDPYRPVWRLDVDPFVVAKAQDLKAAIRDMEAQLKVLRESQIALEDLLNEAHQINVTDSFMGRRGDMPEYEDAI